ncbi:multicopper oxidase domain-containing protein, partial [Zavarzinia sp.]|uniref:multicopper oxidase domain-containing protein n=1 Tax=Zavarzinia sp. TaxID=2027920 RepID=UPI003BB6BB1B
PAMRADLALIAPDEAGAVIELHDVWQSTPVVLARFEVAGEPLPMAGRDRPLALPPAELPEPDLANAVKLELDLGAGVTDPAVAEFQKLFGADEICTTQRVFWSLNTRAWPGMAATGKPEPLAVMKSGTSYIVEIFNGTPHRHPMHLHGHTFKVIGSSKRDVPVHWADTVLLEPKERLKIAFVGGEPGDWMVHCHIIEHQETGMMGYYRVA